jgi:hypothetical protein
LNESTRSARITPGDHLEQADLQSTPSSRPTSALRLGRGSIGIVDRGTRSPSQDRTAVDCETQAAISRTLLVAKVLLHPWPEFREHEAVASTSVAASAEILEDRKDDIPETLKERLSSLASSGIAQHASRLKKTWPSWGKPLPANEVPGASLVFRECLLLCFLHAASALTQCCAESRFWLWVIQPLREGLALAIVLFGPKHPLALRLINACQRLLRPCKTALHQQPPLAMKPASGGGCRRGGSQPTREIPRCFKCKK